METPNAAPTPQPPATPAPQAPAAPQAVATPTVSFAEFKKLDLRVAKIVAVENHPKADKLYVLKVSLGDSERQIVAGVKPFYTPEQLLGKCVVVVTNIEPAMLRGVQSQGMMLAANDGGRVLFVQPEREATPGSRVS